MTDQSRAWSEAAAGYEAEFIDPVRRPGPNPLLDALAALPRAASLVAADLGCGAGPLLPLLSSTFLQVHAVDFAPGMLERARTHAAPNISFHQRSLADLSPLHGTLDAAVAVNSLVMPDLGDLEKALEEIRSSLKPGGRFLGVLPAMDAVHYHTMLLLDRARAAGLPLAAARKNAADHAEHRLHDFAFGGFRYRGLEQHFWQPFEIGPRLRKAGFVRVRRRKLRLAWEQFACGGELRHLPAPWDWFFECRRPR
ncbi:MAG: class I SAM-dependent methyltransferase [Gemmataceae bacterium]|nr:class I SAM-dependent methyltransferase [Gemmataceae bacterium]